MEMDKKGEFAMKKNVWTGILCAMLCLLLCVSAALGETRQGVIAREGTEEPIEETLFESAMGFSFWYASEWLEAYYGEENNIDGVIVETIYSDDSMVFSLISEEDAAEYTGDMEKNITELAADGRVQLDVYREVVDGRYHFLTLIAEKGLYFRAVGEYAEEAAEGNGKLFQLVLDSVTLTPDCLIRAQWGDLTADGADGAQVILTALEPVTDVKLLKLEWEEMAVTWEQAASLSALDAGQAVAVTLQFIGDLPNNGLQYTDAAGETHAFALDISGEDGHLLFWELEQ